MTDDRIFVGRDTELTHIEHVVGDWPNSRLVFINAAGGLGKTRLLQEIYQRYQTDDTQQGQLLVGNIIDFDDQVYHIARNVRYRIAQILGERAFEPYLQKLLQLRLLKVKGMSKRFLQQEFELINHDFVTCFNQVAKQHRVVLLFDTTETLMESEDGVYLSQIVAGLNNCVLIMAGRNATRIAQFWQTQIGQPGQLISLSPLSPLASEIYMQHKQAQNHLVLEANLAAKILLLAQGRPILIDLAIEWLARSISLPWLTELQLERLQMLSPEALQVQQQIFEAQLVNHIVNIRTPLDRLILTMSRVYPLDPQLVQVLLKTSYQTAQQMLEQVLAYVFIKQLPDQRISLHDEMRRMVSQYVWPNVDPDQQRRRRDSRLAATYLNQQIGEIAQNLVEIEQLIITAPTEQLAHFLQKDVLEGRLWHLKGQRLIHILVIDLKQGFDLFIELFGQATLAHQLSFRAILLAIIRPYLDQLTADQTYEVNIRQLWYLADRGQYEAIHQLASQLLAQPNLTLSHQAEFLIQRAEAEIKLGHLLVGIASLNEVVAICRTHELANKLLRALNGRGWVYQNRGNYNAALEDYLTAFTLSVEQNNTEQVAQTLTNLAYVNTMKGHQSEAFQNCYEALELWGTLESPKGMGLTYKTLGEISWRFNRPDQAIGYYEQALDIFTHADNIELMSTVRCQMANTLMMLGQLDEANKHLRWALENGPGSLKPEIFFWQAQVYWKQGNLVEAREWFQRCRHISQQVGEQFNDYKSFVDLTALMWDFKKYYQWQSLYDLHEKQYTNTNNEFFLRLRGSFYRHVADLAICDGEYEAALRFYKLGLPLIALHEYHKPYVVEAQLSQTHKRITDCYDHTQILAKLGQDLAFFWKNRQDLLAKSPNVLAKLVAWQQVSKKQTSTNFCNPAKKRIL
ncbi:tetratricopeptide repeat protein [Anaerolineales bacterium HSG6]|nr:tetratricopeptide repeat protein [Anaerolineales bacterium HSG6]MDM8530133.1 tetratricopeptide repeat protein [Anaerolineales bacterium HSG25]